jgi:hypothetical protein
MSEEQTPSSLAARVEQYNIGTLPGQGWPGYHMGTTYLVNDLWLEVLRLRVENEALRKDAERYRWMRDGNNKDDDRIMSFSGDSLKSGDALDTAIDAARKT